MTVPYRVAYFAAQARILFSPHDIRRATTSKGTGYRGTRPTIQNPLGGAIRVHLLFLFRPYLTLLFSVPCRSPYYCAFTYLFVQKNSYGFLRFPFCFV